MSETPAPEEGAAVAAELSPAELSPAELSPAECAAKLRELFPALFSGTPKPIKLRIQTDIQQRAPGLFTKRALSGFLRRHTGSHSYLIALTRATQRFDLDGAPAGELSDEHRQAAAEELARRRANRAQREAAEQDQRRNRAALLRAFETTTLTPANFCALKGIEPEQLDALLAQAREEASQRPAPPQRDEHARAPRRPDRPRR